MSAAKLLESHIAKGRHLSNGHVSSAAKAAWDAVCRDLLIKAFGAASPNVNDVMDVGMYRDDGHSDADYERGRRIDLDEQLQILVALTDSLKEQASLIGSPHPVSGDITSNRVFVVHGHDESAKHAVARLLERFDLQPIILHEQPNAGRTIIEKFVDYSDVGFAVVLLTGDDRGGTNESNYDSQSLRARQNVILELGYFLGKLGRCRVCALYQQGVEIPSDYQGVLFVPIDGGGAWRFALGKELKAAGLDVDLNKAV